MSTEPSGWEHVHHEADVGVRGWGPTLSVAFEQAGLALTAIVADPQCVRPTIEVAITCEAPSSEVLFVDWLNALIFEMSIQSLLFGRFEVNIENHSLTARAFGEPVDRARHRPAVEPKGATFTALQVEQQSDGWSAQCVVDV